MANYLNFKNNTNYTNLKIPAKILKEGGIVVFPTETVYGIGVNALNKKAIKKLYDIKNRPLNKPISLLVNNIEMIENIAKNITEEEYTLITTFMPGPLTLILKKKEIIPDIVTANSKFVGVRMPANDVALNLIKYANVPLATSSANMSEMPSGTSIASIVDEFKDKVDYYIDGGISKIGLASTIVQIINREVHILREGPISKTEIDKILSNKI